MYSLYTLLLILVKNIDKMFLDILKCYNLFCNIIIKYQNALPSPKRFIR
jgi:hypothetical protein